MAEVGGRVNYRQHKEGYQEEIRKVVSTAVRVGVIKIAEIMPDLERIPERFIEEHLKWLVDTGRWAPYRGHMGQTLELTYERLIWEAKLWLKDNVEEITRLACAEAGMLYPRYQSQQSNGLDYRPMRNEIKNWRR